MATMYHAQWQPSFAGSWLPRVVVVGHPLGASASNPGVRHAGHHALPPNATTFAESCEPPILKIREGLRLDLASA